MDQIAQTHIPSHNKSKSTFLPDEKYFERLSRMKGTPITYPTHKQMFNSEIVMYEPKFADELCHIVLHEQDQDSEFFHNGGSYLQAEIETLPPHLESLRFQKAHELYETLLEPQGHKLAFSITPQEKIAGYIAWQEHPNIRKCYAVKTYPHFEGQGNAYRMVSWLAELPGITQLQVGRNHPRMDKLLARIAKNNYFSFNKKTSTITRETKL